MAFLWAVGEDIVVPSISQQRKNLKEFLTLMNNGLHALLSEILQLCFDIKMRNNGAINLRKDLLSA